MKKLVIICYFLAIQIFVGFNSFCQRVEPFIEFESPSVPWGLIFTRDDGMISLDDDFVARLWEINTGKLQREFRAHSDRLMTAAVSPDGKLFATASKDKKICVWEISSGNLISTLTGHDGIISGMSFSPDGKFLISGGYDKTIRTWDFTNGTQLSIFPQTENEIFTISFSPDGKLILSCGGELKYDEPSEILVWDVDSKSVISDLSQFKFKVVSYGGFIFNSENLLLMNNPGNSLLEIDLKVRKIVNNFPLTPSKMHPFGITKDTDFVFCGSSPKITIFSRSRAFEPITLTDPKGFTAFSIREDGKYFATGSDVERVARSIRVFQTDKIPVVGDQLKKLYTEKIPEVALKDSIPKKEEIVDPKMVEARKLDRTNLIGKFEDYSNDHVTGYNPTRSYLVPYFTTPEFNKTLFGLETFHPKTGYTFSLLHQSELDKMSVDDLYNSIQRNGLFTKSGYYELDYTRIPELTLYFAELKNNTKYEIAAKKDEILSRLNKTRKAYIAANLYYSAIPFKVYGSGIIYENEYNFDNQQAIIHLFLNHLIDNRHPNKVYVASFFVSLSLAEAENLFTEGKVEGEVIFKLLPGANRVELGTNYVIMPDLSSVENAQITFVSEKTKQKHQFFANLKGGLWPNIDKRWAWQSEYLPEKMNRPNKNNIRIISGGRVTK